MARFRHGLTKFFMKHWLYKSGWRLLPGLLAASLTLITARTGVLQPFEHSVYRFLFHVRGEQSWDDRVTVIEIDQPSLDAIGPFPWPRHHYTELLDKLTDADSSVVAFDILFAESTGDDAALAEAMERHGNVVLATAWNEQQGVIGPNANVVESAIATGHIHHHADTDGITRTYNPKINDTPALSIAAVQNYEPAQLSALASINSFQQNLWLNWRGFSDSSPRYSFIDVLNGKIPAATFTNKIVFIGYTGVDQDVMTTPYNQNPPSAGVYQHIVAANNLLAQNHLKPIVLPVWVMLMVLSPVGGYILFYRRYRLHLLANLIIIVIWSGGVILAFHSNYLLPTVVPVVTIATTSFLVRLTERLQSKLQGGHLQGVKRQGIKLGKEVGKEVCAIKPKSIYKAVVD